LALATGVRPFLPPLIAGALARADAGIDFSSSDYSFLESIPFLVAMIALGIGAVAVERMAADRWLTIVLGAAAAALGAFEFAGSLADRGHPAGAGLAAGAAAALLAYLATTTLLNGAQARLAARQGGGRRDGGAVRAGLTVYAEAAAVVIAIASIFAEPLAYVALAFLVWVLIQARRRATRKYEGLRVLR
jgi:hypothetical protein